VEQLRLDLEARGAEKTALLQEVGRLAEDLRKEQETRGALEAQLKERSESAGSLEVRLQMGMMKDWK